MVFVIDPRDHVVFHGLGRGSIAVVNAGDYDEMKKRQKDDKNVTHTPYRLLSSRQTLNPSPSTGHFVVSGSTHLSPMHTINFGHIADWVNTHALQLFTSELSQLLFAYSRTGGFVVDLVNMSHS